MAEKEFKANISANLDDFNVSTKKAKQIAKDAEREIKSLDKTLGDARLLERRRKELNQLNQAQADGIELTKDDIKLKNRLASTVFSLENKLEKQHVSTNKLGESVAKLSGRKKQLNGIVAKSLRLEKHETSAINKQTKAINHQVRAEERLAKSKKKRSKIGSAMSGLKSKAGGMISGMGGMGGLKSGIGAIMTGIGTPIAIANSATELAQDNKRANEMGTSYQMVKGIEALTAGSDITKENILDPFEEMTNKIGDWKIQGGFGKSDSDLARMMKAAGVDYKVLDSFKTTQEKTAYLLDKGLKLNAEDARHFFDVVGGGESNKIAAGLKSAGVSSIADIAAAYNEINKVTGEGINGAAEYVGQMSVVTQKLGSGWQEFSGLVMGQFSKYLSGFGEWFDQVWSSNKEDIQKVSKWLGDQFGMALNDIKNVVNSVVGAFRLIKGAFNLITNIFEDLIAIAVFKAKDTVFLASDKDKAAYEKANAHLNSKEVQDQVSFVKKYGTQALTGVDTDTHETGKKNKLGESITKQQLDSDKRTSSYRTSLDNNTAATKKLTQAQKEAIELERQRNSEMYANSAIASAYEGRAASMSNNYNVSMNNNVGIHPRAAAVLERGRDTINKGFEDLSMSHFDDQLALI